MLMPRRDVERLRAGIETHMAFVEIIFLPVDIGLPHVPDPKSPLQGRRKRFLALADRQRALLRVSHQFVAVRTNLKLQTVMLAKTFRAKGWNRSLTHRRALVGCSLLEVAKYAGGGACEFFPWRVASRRPPTRALDPELCRQRNAASSAGLSQPARARQKPEKDQPGKKSDQMDNASSAHAHKPMGGVRIKDTFT